MFHVKHISSDTQLTDDAIYIQLDAKPRLHAEVVSSKTHGTRLTPLTRSAELQTQI